MVFCHDIYFGDRDIYNTFKTGTYSEGDRQSWGASYKGIRQASIFIQNIDIIWSLQKLKELT